MERPAETNYGHDKRRFQIHNCLGSGGFGEVYRATMKSAGGLQTEVAVKVLHASLDTKSQAVQRLRDEAKLLGILNHPAILRVTDLVSLEGRIALVTEYVEGADLAECFTASDPISLRATLQVIAQIADALDAAYNTETDGEPLRLVHRDIKPANIRIGKHGDAKLLDFGIARADNLEREAKTQTNTVIGSFAYMAPERFERHDTVELAGDIYSLGCVLFEQITGSPFYEEIPLRQQYLLALNSLKYLEHLENQLDKTRSAPNEVQMLLRRLLSYEPDMRPAHRELIQLCEDLADNLPGTPLRRWCRTREWDAPAEEESAAFSGRVITESTLSSTNEAAQRELSSYPRSGTTGETLASELDLTTSDRDPGASGLASNRVLLGGIALSVSVLTSVLIVFLGGLLLYANSTDSLDGTPQPVSETVNVDPEEDVEVGDKAASTPSPSDAAPAEKPQTQSPKPNRSAPPSKAQEVVSTPTPPKSTSSKATKEPQPETTPIPETSRWLVKGSINAELRSGSERYAPGETPPGNYTIWADFPDGWVSAGTITLAPGVETAIQCSALKYHCTEIK